MSKDKFYDEVLIKLHRKYGKDDLVRHLKLECDKKDTIINSLVKDLDDAKLKICKHELRFNVNIDNRFKESNKYSLMKQKHEKQISGKNNNISGLNKKIKELMVNISYYKKEIYRLKKKIKGE